jgi:exopolysaccharide biosynthesis polyprenyl glycosylphosphotransferase
MGYLGEPVAEAAPWHHLGPVDSIAHVLHHQVVDEVAICMTASELPGIADIAEVCEEEGKIVRVPLDVPQLGLGMRLIEDLNGTPVLSIISGPNQLLSLALKRLLDIFGAACGLVLLSPVLLGAALYILLKDGEPVIFRQVRIGRHGRPFTIYKFRTMVKDAEARADELAERSETKGPAFKMRADPRITPWGHRLRQTSIDELPQLLNVLKGDMSLVGPRPAPPREVAGYDLWHRRRLSMKPGMTGLWQVSSRLDVDFDERAQLDLEYIDRWSLWLDMKIVLRTVPAILDLNGH